MVGVRRTKRKVYGSTNDANDDDSDDRQRRPDEHALHKHHIRAGYDGIGDQSEQREGDDEEVGVEGVIDESGRTCWFRVEVRAETEEKEEVVLLELLVLVFMLTLTLVLVVVVVVVVFEVLCLFVDGSSIVQSNGCHSPLSSLPFVSPPVAVAVVVGIAVCAGADVDVGVVVVVVVAATNLSIPFTISVLRSTQHIHAHRLLDPDDDHEQVETFHPADQQQEVLVRVQIVADVGEERDGENDNVSCVSFQNRLCVK